MDRYVCSCALLYPHKQSQCAILLLFWLIRLLAAERCDRMKSRSRLPLALTSKGGSSMQEAGVSFLTTWQSFYTIIGSAGATLTGLMFVVITLIAGGRVRASSVSGGVADFNTPHGLHFFLSALVAPILHTPGSALLP